MGVTKMTITKKVGRILGWKWEQTTYTTAYGEVKTIIAVKEKLKLPKAEVSAQSLLDDCGRDHTAYRAYLQEEAGIGLI
jgi:hypothetical protein